MPRRPSESPEAQAGGLEVAAAHAAHAPMPPPGGMAGMADSFSGRSVMSASVVSSNDAIDAAFCSAIRSTFVGSMIPACHHVHVLVPLGVEALARRHWPP